MNIFIEYADKNYKEAILIVVKHETETSSCRIPSQLQRNETKSTSDKTEWYRTTRQYHLRLHLPETKSVNKKNIIRQKRNLLLMLNSVK